MIVDYNICNIYIPNSIHPIERKKTLSNFLRIPEYINDKNICLVRMCGAAMNLKTQLLEKNCRDA